jgi:DNA-binding protein YbaB
LIFFLFLAGCSEPDPADILEEAQQVQEDLSSAELDFEENEGDATVTGNVIFDYDNNVSYYKMNEGFALYKDDSDFLIEYEDGMVADALEETYADPEEAESAIDGQLDFMKMPLAFFTQLDADFYNKFDMESRDNDYVLTYNGNQTDQEELGRGIVQQTIEPFGSEMDSSDIDIEEFSLQIIIEKETNRMQTVEQELIYSLDHNNFSQEQNFTYTYFNHDETAQIEKPVVTMEPEDTDNTDIAEMDSLNEEEQEIMANEAAAYLDALIQATVFQDAEEFINRAPDSYTDEEKESEAETQRDYFREIYIQNTQQNMQGSSVTEDEVMELADAFLHALSTTEYEIAGAYAESADNIIVTVAIEGIDDTSVYIKTEEDLVALYEDGELADDEIDAKNIELLIENYYEMDELLDPVELDVHVMQHTDGTYMVLMQDQYLSGFVQ